MLAVDNFNGAKVLGRTIRCDHCQDYHEEQAKDPANLPEHVTRNLSEKELDKKRREVEAPHLVPQRRLASAAVRKLAECWALRPHYQLG